LRQVQTYCFIKKFRRPPLKTCTRFLTMSCKPRSLRLWQTFLKSFKTTRQEFFYVCNLKAIAIMRWYKLQALSTQTRCKYENVFIWLVFCYERKDSNSGWVKNLGYAEAHWECDLYTSWVLCVIVLLWKEGFQFRMSQELGMCWIQSPANNYMFWEFSKRIEDERIFQSKNGRKQTH